MAIIVETMIFGGFWPCVTWRKLGVWYKGALETGFSGESPVLYRKKRLVGHPRGRRFEGLNLPVAAS